MKPAEQITEHVRGLYGWAGYHAQWKVWFNSHALATRAGVIFVDPLRPSPAAVRQLESLGKPLAVVLTNASHQRDAAWFRRRYDIQIYAHEKAPADCDIKIDMLVLDGEKLPGGLTAVHLPGVSASEMMYYTKHRGGILLIGDTLIHEEDGGLMLLPESYCEDRRQAVRSLPRLLDREFKTAAFAHGPPILEQARKKVAKFLRTLKISS